MDKHIFSLSRGGLRESYLSHRVLVTIAWVRLFFFVFLLGLLVGLRDWLPGGQHLVWLTFALGLYNIVVALLLKYRRDDTARWVGGSLDTLTLIFIIFLLSGSGSPGNTSLNLMRITLFLALPLSLVQFGVFVGVAVYLGVASWFLLMYSLWVAPSEGLWMVLAQFPGIVVLGGLVVSLRRNLRRQQLLLRQSNNELLPLPNLNGGRELSMDDVSLPAAVIRPLSKPKKIRLYISEEQHILKMAYECFFPFESGIEVVGVCGESTGEYLVRDALSLKPDVMLLGLKILGRDTVDKVEMVKESCPDVAMVILSAQYDAGGIKALREYSRSSPTACAYLLKHTVDTVEQLAQIVRSVADGRFILDPAVMEGMMSASDSGLSLLKELSPVELEVLMWMAKGYRDDTIAHILNLKPTTLERHINNIYSRIGECPDSVDARVHAITLYLKATGMLSSGEMSAG